jgi:DNA-3-methyladenine glycosylase I
MAGPRAIPGVAIGDDGRRRCWWSGEDSLYRKYHDDEWGRPVATDRRLFEKLSLEGFQSGLSWITILRKRESFRAAFKNFDHVAVARFRQRDVARLMKDASIVRNRAKIEATIGNARRCDDLISEFGSLAAYVWRFEPQAAARPAKLDRAALMKLSTTVESIALSKDLRKRGWSFVGPTTVYAFMQAMGLVNDHLVGCDVRSEAERQRRAFKRPGA